MTGNFVDCHCHLIPAIDDGSADLRESLEMARILADFGFGTVHCTPHRISGCYENEPERVTRATAILQRHLDQAGIALRLLPGTEHYMDEHLMDLLPGALTAHPGCLLVEAPFMSDPAPVEALIAGIGQRGLVPLIAHPERCSAFDPSPAPQGLRGLFSLGRGEPKEPDLEGALVLRLLESGCRFQGNLGSFAGVYGREIRERALLFLKHGVYACVGSDAHRPERLAATLNAGLDAVLAAIGEEGAGRLLAGKALSP